jgi:hypothetical protein
LCSAENFDVESSMVTNGFWVVFDTAARPDRPAYYRDVHDVLAYPVGGIVRYTYRDDYHSADARAQAVRAAENPDFGRDEVLVVYAQTRDYKTGNASPGPNTPSDSMFWVATRLGRMERIWRAGNNFDFDFTVKGYPAQNQEALDKILKGLIDGGEVPFSKWVAYVADETLLSPLRTSGPQVDAANANWQSIVKAMGSPPSQFAGDLFWRVVSITDGKGEVRTPVPYETKASGAALPTPRMCYRFFEGEDFTLEIARHSPPTQSLGGAGVTPPSDKVRIEIPSPAPLAPLGATEVRLRPTGSEKVPFRVARSDDLTNRLSTIRLTSPTDGSWPVGPEVTWVIVIAKRPSTLVLGVLLPVFAAALVAIGTILLREQDLGKKVAGAICIAAGPLCLLGAWWVLFRKVPQKL